MKNTSIRTLALAAVIVASIGAAGVANAQSPMTGDVGMHGHMMNGKEVQGHKEGAMDTMNCKNGMMPGGTGSTNHGAGGENNGHNQSAEGQHNQSTHHM